MDNKHTDAAEILGNFGDIDDLSLENLFNSVEGNDEIDVLSPSQYYTNDNLNAKFDSLLAYIKNARHQGITFHITCIQESWLKDDSDLCLFQINGYNCFSRGHRCTSYGGILTYVDESINACALDVEISSQIWEGMFLLIKDNHTEKETILGNICRPPHDNNNKENLQTFVSELNPVLSRLSDNNNNTHYVNRDHFSDFLDLMLG